MQDVGNVFARKTTAFRRNHNAEFMKIVGLRTRRRLQAPAPWRSKTCIESDVDRSATKSSARSRRSTAREFYCKTLSPRIAGTQSLIVWRREKGVIDRRSQDPDEDGLLRSNRHNTRRFNVSADFSSPFVPLLPLSDFASVMNLNVNCREEISENSPVEFFEELCRNHDVLRQTTWKLEPVAVDQTLDVQVGSLVTSAAPFPLESLQWQHSLASLVSTPKSCRQRSR